MFSLSVSKAAVSTLILAVLVAAAESLGSDLGLLANPYIKDFVSCFVHTVDVRPSGLAFRCIYFCCIRFIPHSSPVISASACFFSVLWR